MIYKNLEIHNVAALIPNGEGITWLRVPESVQSKMELPGSRAIATNSTGVELRFVMESDQMSIRMKSLDPPETGVVSTFQIFYGGIPGGWQDFEIGKYVGSEPKTFHIQKPVNLELLRKMSAQASLPWDPQVIRILFNRGQYCICDVTGDIRPPKQGELPCKTILSYGSSITHGSNAQDVASTWASIVAHNLNMDCRNLGMAGNCAIEPEMADYIAEEGEKGRWDIATLELGINVLGWDAEKICRRVSYAVSRIASRNPEKPIFVISPLYSGYDFCESPDPGKWREEIARIVTELDLPNVHLVNGLNLLGDMSGISADEIHPNCYGVQQIAQRLTAIIAAAVHQSAF